jgi:hypothetical protein
MGFFRFNSNREKQKLINLLTSGKASSKPKIIDGEKIIKLQIKSLVNLAELNIKKSKEFDKNTLDTLSLMYLSKHFITNLINMLYIAYPNILYKIKNNLGLHKNDLKKVDIFVKNVVGKATADLISSKIITKLIN